MIFDVKFTVFKLIHPQNVLPRIKVTPDGTVKDVNASHPKNTVDPIDVTEDGIFIDIRFLQFSKALLHIDAIFDVIFAVLKLVKSLNAYCWMEDTFSWISMFCTCSFNCDHGEEE